MASKKERRQEGDSLLEALRLERTTFTQDEFCVRCGIPRSTYQRWVKGETQAKLTIPQLKQMAILLKIECIRDLPDDFGPQKKTERSQPSDPVGDEEE